MQVQTPEVGAEKASTPRYDTIVIRGATGKNVPRKVDGGEVVAWSAGHELAALDALQEFVDNLAAGNCSQHSHLTHEAAAALKSCGKDGAECGQGWYQKVLPEAKGLKGRLATLAPLLHWRVCHVWEWLKHWAPLAEFGDWSTAMIADAYGGDEAEEINARTGCTGCPLASEEKALETVLAMPHWAYLAPLRGLKELWRELREPQHRLRKAGIERLKDGSIAANPQRMGPILLESRLMGLERVLAIQAECNAAADRLGRPRIDLINTEEEARIRELIAAGTWPDGWDGDEPIATTPLDKVFADGAVQPLLFC